MSEIAKRTVTELAARYELEPQLADVYVEGSFDREILSACQRDTTISRVIYEIDTVDIPSSTLQKYGLTSGNKQRVIALACELAMLGDQVQFDCLVDKDFDHWFGPLQTVGRLRWSMYCSMELHFLTKEIVRDILLTTGRAKIKNLDNFLDSLVVVLRDLYVLRLADRQTSLTLRWVALRRYLSRDGDYIRFARGAYAVAVLASNQCTARRTEFDDACGYWSQNIAGDFRDYARGHDFVALLAWAMQVFDGHKEFATEQAIQRLLVLLARNVPTLMLELRCDATLRRR